MLIAYLSILRQSIDILHGRAINGGVAAEYSSKVICFKLNFQPPILKVDVEKLDELLGRWCRSENDDIVGIQTASERELL